MESKCSSSHVLTVSLCPWYPWSATYELGSKYISIQLRLDAFLKEQMGKGGGGQGRGCAGVSIRNLRRDVFERCMSTRSGHFVLLGSNFSQILRQFVSVRVKILSKTHLVASRYAIKKGKASHLLDMPRPETFLLQLPYKHRRLTMFYTFYIHVDFQAEFVHVQMYLIKLSSFVNCLKECVADKLKLHFLE